MVDHLAPRPDPEAEQRQRLRVLWAVRVVFALVWIAVTFIAIFKFGAEGGRADEQAVRLARDWWWPLIVSLSLFATVLIIDVVTPTKKLQTISGVFVGLLAGVLAAVAVGFVLDLVSELAGIRSATVVGAAKILIGVALAYLGITVVMQTQDDFRLIIPYVEFAKQIRGPRPLVLDTSAIIDARILDVGETGIIQAPIVVPGFVVAELQQLADSSDRLKRARGRRGLDVVARLQRSPRLDVTIDETLVTGKSVDQMLVELARQISATVATTDSGLDRVARIQGVPTLNMNDVAIAMRAQAGPGESLRVRLVKPGEHSGQGVGYLEDGTMVVAEDGASHVGQEVALTVTNSLQTSAGRLIFGRIGGSNGDDAAGADEARRLEGPTATEAPELKGVTLTPRIGGARPPEPETAATPAEPPRPSAPGRNPRRGR